MKLRVWTVFLMALTMVLCGCASPDRGPVSEMQSSLHQAQRQLMDQMRAAGATPAQLREVQRQWRVLERNMKNMEQHLERMEKSGAR